MHLRHALTTILLAICWADNVLGRNVLRVRQGSGTVASTSPTPTHGGATTSNTSPPTSSRTSTGTTKAPTSKQTQKQTADGGPTHVITTSHPSATPAAGSQNATASAENNELPLTPVITPAIGITGVILLVTGLAYAIIGIKHKWLLVFLSAAYLASLSITVLIIYVMSPPVSDAIQGAYFVAAVCTGLIFGAISLVFKEVTEGFGCIVGGFCLSMWFLVLKPGGLIESTTGKAIMIAAFSAVGWSLAFSQYTRTYGTIVSTSFGGAMISMIGIDCFSRAGLKEFWIYIWALNDKEFPIHTTTYPITRGIRVEIAGTVVLCLFGIMSQIKIWKIVRERKLKHEAERLQDDQKREQRDSKIGKRVEKNNERSLARWEALYGGSKTAINSAAGTSDDSDPKKSTSVAEREIGSIEMDDISTVTGTRTSRDVRTSVMEILPEHQTALELHLDVGSGDYGWWQDFRSNKAQSNGPSAPEYDPSSLAEMLPSSARPPVRPVESLPSTKEEQAESSDKLVHERRGVPLDKLALQKLNAQAPAALPRIEDDRASSVAATLDDEPDMADTDLKRLSVAPSIFLETDKGGLSPFDDEFKIDDKTHTPVPSSPGEMPILEDDDEEVIRSPTADIESEQQTPRKISSRQKKRSSKSSNHRDVGSGNEDAESESEKAPSVHSLKEHNLPESISKVAMAYRTNEWAKHIADANQPDIEEEPEAEVEEPSVQVEYQRPAKEQPKSVDAQALLETGAAAPERKNTKTSIKPHRQSSKDGKGRRSSGSATPIYAFQRTNSNQSLQRQSSSHSIQQPKLDRKASQPFSSQILESPIEEAESSHYETPLGSTINLLDDRNHRLQKRMTTTSFNALNIATAAEPPVSETGTADNIPLSQRKELLDSGALNPTPLSPPTSSKPRPSTLSRTASTQNQNLIYDSHQPRRSNTVDTRKQSAMLTQWRQSLQQEANPTPMNVAEEQARMQMIMQQRQVEHQARKKEREKEGRERERDVAMRTSLLAGAHQDALRRMQAKALTGVGGSGGKSS